MARKSAIKVVIAYEDFEAAMRARQLSDHLAAQLKPRIEISNELWRFDFLRYFELRDQAFNSAATADLIIVSAHGDAELPIHVKDWIESWLPEKRNRSAALVAILDNYKEIPGQSPSPCAYMRHVAKRAGMDFFFKAGERWQPDLVSAIAMRHQVPVASLAIETEADPNNAPWQSWGIND